MASVPNSKKKKFPKSTTEMSKEQLQETLKKKKECNAKALSVVEQLCEKEVEKEWFLSNLEFINQCHFDDVVVERTLLKMCGYPLCSNGLGEVPAKKYQISTRYNKVFDITERKNFCSTICYKAAVYIKNQLLTSPLWFRDQEKIPKFVLLKSSSSSIGEEVIFKEEIHLESEKDKKENNENDNEKSNMDCDKKNEVNENLIKNSTFKDEHKENSTENLKLNEENVDRMKNLNITEEKNSNEALVDKIDITSVLQKSSKPESVETKKPKPECLFPKTSNIELEKPEKELPTDPVLKVEQCIYEWFNLSSMLYLLGEEKVKELFRDKTNEIKEALKCTTMKEGYCERIDRMIKFFSVMDIQLSDDGIRRDLKPLPNYSFIKEEGKNLEVKVRAFFKGQLEIEPPEETPKDNESSESNESQARENIYLPLVDAHAQNALRKRILLDKLNKILPDLLRTFSLEFPLDMSEVRNLVSSFTLKPHNITFRPAEWYLVGIILIKLLSLKFKQLQMALETSESKKNLTLLLMSYNLKENYLNNIVEWLMNSDSIIKKLDDR